MGPKTKTKIPSLSRFATVPNPHSLLFAILSQKWIKIAIIPSMKTFSVSPQSLHIVTRSEASESQLADTSTTEQSTPEKKRKQWAKPSNLNFLDEITPNEAMTPW